jgi:phosphatidylserine decarboxylase
MFDYSSRARLLISLLVNPQAVNEPGFDVFTDNKRSILTLTHTATGEPIAFVAIGAMLVGSIVWTCKLGQQIKKGDELGYFAYGGSTVICVFPKGVVSFDKDLVEASQQPIETLVKVGYSLGTKGQ